MKTPITLTFIATAALLTAGEIPAPSVSEKPLSERLADSTKELKDYAERKEREAKAHESKAKELNDRVQGVGVEKAQKDLEKVAVDNFGKAASGTKDYVTGRKDKTFTKGVGMTKSLGDAEAKRDNALAEVADSELTSERDKEHAAADAAKKEAKAARDKMQANANKAAADKAAADKAAADKAAADKAAAARVNDAIQKADRLGPRDRPSGHPGRDYRDPPTKDHPGNGKTTG